MAKTKQELLDNLPNNTAGAIEPVHIRDIVEESYNKSRLIYSGIVHLNTIDATEELNWNGSSIGPTDEIRRSDFETDKPTNTKWGGNTNRFITPSYDIYVDDEYFEMKSNLTLNGEDNYDRWVLKNGGIGFTVGDNFRTENGVLTHTSGTSSPYMNHIRTKITRQSLRHMDVYDSELDYVLSVGEGYNATNAQLAWNLSKFDVYAGTQPSLSYLPNFDIDIANDAVIDITVNTVGSSNQATDITINKITGGFTTGDCISIQSSGSAEPMILEYRGVWEPLDGNPRNEDNTGKLRPRRAVYNWMYKTNLKVDVEDYLDVQTGVRGISILKPTTTSTALPKFFQPTKTVTTYGNRASVTTYAYKAARFSSRTAIYDLSVTDDPYDHIGNSAYEDSPPFWGDAPYFIHGNPSSQSQAKDDYDSMVNSSSSSTPFLHRTESWQPGRQIIKIYVTE